jgi:sugar phosphate isomerase/epimerase
VAKRLFGVSTHLYRAQRLNRDHLREIAAHGFEVVELATAPGHVDYSNPAAIADVQQWLAEAGLQLAAMYARVGAEGTDNAEQALLVARRIPVKVFVVQLDGTREVTRRHVERLAEAAGPLGVTIAIDGADLSRPGSLVHFVEEDTEADVAICLDLGRAHRDGDLVDAIETVAEHLVAMRLPLDSTIDWPSALTTVQKVGYEGPLMFDLETRGSTKDMLARARTAREKMERWLTST